MTRAVLEGVAFGLRDGLDLMTAAGLSAPARSALRAAVPQARCGGRVLADVLGAEIATVDTSEGAAYGAGLLAAVGAGWFPTVEAATGALVSATAVAEPGADGPRYAEAHSVYQALYPALAPSFRQM